MAEDDTNIIEHARAAIQIVEARMYNELRKLNRSGVYRDMLTPELIPDMGVRAKTTQWGWIVLKRTFYNWRVLDCRNDPFTNEPTQLSGWSRGWCYAEPKSALRALAAVLAWSGRPDTEPSGWIKSLPDQRINGKRTPGIEQE